MAASVGREPGPSAHWLARHRSGVRLGVLLLILVFVTLMSLDAARVGIHWATVLVPLSMLLTSWDIGWHVPQTVDRWEEAKRKGQEKG